jgi:hypothetical protein
MPILLDTWWEKIRKIMVPSQCRQKVCKTLSQPIAGSGDVHLSSQLHYPSYVGSINRRIVI